MEAGGICRRTLVGHKDDVLDIAGVPLGAAEVGAASAPSPAAANRANGGGAHAANGAAANGEAPPALVPAWGDGCGAVAALFASASADGTVRMWSASCWSCVRIFAVGVASTMPFLAVAVTPK
jgi:hypothetical protein